MINLVTTWKELTGGMNEINARRYKPSAWLPYQEAQATIERLVGEVGDRSLVIRRNGRRIEVCPGIAEAYKAWVFRRLAIDTPQTTAKTRTAQTTTEVKAEELLDGATTPESNHEAEVTPELESPAESDLVNPELAKLALTLTQQIIHRHKVDPFFGSQTLLRMIGKLVPSLSDEVQSLSRHIDLNENEVGCFTLLTPYKIACKLHHENWPVQDDESEFGSQLINTVLMEVGLQLKEYKAEGKWEWHLTAKGKEYAVTELIASRETGELELRILWKEGVLPLIRNHFAFKEGVAQ